ncbi:MAG: hypothetical protein LBQ48_00350 [Oscillospiraceae bacterium]|nr:hypothetical protein [Oscillospiraceae bacterium]
MKSFLTKMPKQAVFALAAALGALVGDIITEILPIQHNRLGGLTVALFTTAVWSICQCLGISAGIVAAQNKLVYKPFIQSKQIGPLLIGGIVGGAIAGLAAQGLYSFIGNLIALSHPQLFNIGMRSIAWGLMGAIAALSMSRHISNFSKKWALPGGFIGGVIGCLVFLPIASFFGAVAARIFGAFLLGLCVGCLVGFVESAFREAWLNVIYAPNEITKINLGANPVSFGTGGTDTVFVRGSAPGALGFKLENGAILCTENGRQRTVSPGDQIPLGKIKIEVCSPKAAGNRASPASGAHIPANTSAAKTLILSVKKYQLALTDGQKLYACHTVGDSSDGRTVTGEVTTRKSDPSQIGIRNLSDDVWTFVMQGKTVTLEKGKVVPLSVDTQGEITVRFKDSAGRIAIGNIAVK